jgi:SAM-dependent methyltransferase
MTKYPPCPIYEALADEFPAEAASGALVADLQRLMTVIVGRAFSPTEPPARSARHRIEKAAHGALERVGPLARRLATRPVQEPMSLSEFYAGGGRQATRLDPFLDGHQRVLEYGGGIGRLATHLATGHRRIVSCDVDTLTTTYGPRLCPDVEFVLLDQLDDQPVFDFAYSVAVFFHLDDDAQRAALDYVHRRLRSGGHFLVDLKLGPSNIAMSRNSGFVRTTPEQAFVALGEEFFEVMEVPLFNQAFLFTKA